MKWLLCLFLFIFSLCLGCKNHNQPEQQVQINDSGIYYFDSLVKFGESQGLLMPEMFKRIKSYEGNSFANDLKNHLSEKRKTGIFPYDISRFGFGKKINEYQLDRY